MWKVLEDSPKRQQLTTIQRAFYDIARRLSIRAHIIATSSLLNMDLSLGFRLDHREDPGTDLHNFCLGQHSSTAWNVLKDRVDPHQVIVDGGISPTLADASYLTAPYGVSFPETVAMARSAYACLWVVIDTLPGRDHPISQGMNVAILMLIGKETELEEYPPRDPSLKPNILALLNWWTQIRVSA